MLDSATNASFDVAPTFDLEAVLAGAPLSRWVRYGFPGNQVPLEISYDMKLDPGVYYGGLTVKDQAHVEMRPGLYIIAGGTFQMRNADVDLTSVRLAYVPSNLPAVELDKMPTFDGGGTVRLTPAIYFGGVRIHGDRSVQLAPGPYVMVEGSLDIPAGTGLSPDVTLSSL